MSFQAVPNQLTPLQDNPWCTYLCYHIILHTFKSLYNIGVHMHVIKLKNSFYDANAYLVDGKMLIDVGIDSTSIIAQLENHLSSDLETIILTHCHFDHSGGAKEVASEFGAKIAIHMEDARLLYNPESRFLFTGDTVFQEGGFGRTDFYGGSALKLIESLRKLSMLDVSVMYPGHGDIVTEDANG